MPENEEPRPGDEDGRPTPISRQIERLITDVENWLRPRPRVWVIDMPYPEEWRKEDEECEKSRDNAAKAGKTIATALVKRGESARAVFSILNSLEGEDYAQARKDWPAVKVELQEAAIRLRLQDEATPVRQSPGEGGDGMTDNPTSNIPGRITAPAEILEPEVVALLLRVPERWQVYRPDELSEPQSQALFLLTAAGMVERRERMRLMMLNHPLIVEATITATGEYGGVEAMMPLAAQMWKDWQDAFRRWQEGHTHNIPPFHCERLEPAEWRLTDQGIIARKDVKSGNKDIALDFVLKRGFFDGLPYQKPDGSLSIRRPVRGKGALVRIKKLKGEPPNALEIANWGDGAEAFAKAFAGLTHISQPSPGAMGAVFPWGRASLALALLIVLELFAVIGAWQWGDGNNLLQKIGNCWWLLAFVFTAATLVSPLILGRVAWSQVKKIWHSWWGEA